MLKHQVFLDTEDYLIAMWSNEMLQITCNLKTYYMDVRNITSIVTTYSRQPDRDGKFDKNLIDIEMKMINGHQFTFREVPWKQNDALPSIFDFSWRNPPPVPQTFPYKAPELDEKPVAAQPKMKKKRPKNPNIPEEIPPVNNNDDGYVEYEKFEGTWDGIPYHNTDRPCQRELDRREEEYQEKKRKIGDLDRKAWDKKHPDGLSDGSYVGSGSIKDIHHKRRQTKKYVDEYIQQKEAEEAKNK
jgi:hypothetical protein